jgi:hypothetical protein
VERRRTEEEAQKMKEEEEDRKRDSLWERVLGRSQLVMSQGK